MGRPRCAPKDEASACDVPERSLPSVRQHTGAGLRRRNVLALLHRKGTSVRRSNTTVYFSSPFVVLQCASRCFFTFSFEWWRPSCGVKVD